MSRDFLISAFCFIFVLSKYKTMAIKRYLDWRQFYIVFEDGREEPYGKPRLLSVPARTKAWKDLLLISGNQDVKCVGYRTIKNPNI